MLFDNRSWRSAHEKYFRTSEAMLEIFFGVFDACLTREMSLDVLVG